MDRTWPRPRHTRHCWVIQSGPHSPPVQGFVLDWRQNRRRRWEALVLYVPSDSAPVLDWVPIDKLGPVPVMSRQMPGNPDYFAGF